MQNGSILNRFSNEKFDDDLENAHGIRNINAAVISINQKNNLMPGKTVS